MNILIVTDVYIPNANSSAVLLRDLALNLSGKKMNVYILALFEANIEKSITNKSLSEENGVNVLRVRNLKKKNVSLIRRGLSEVMLPHLLYRSYRKYLSNVKPDIIICYSPPITLERTVARLKKKYGSKVYLVLRDIFPQCAKDVGVLRAGFVFNYFKSIEKELYQISDFLGVQANRDLIELSNEYDFVKGKIELLNNWIDVSQFEKAIVRDFRKEYGLENKIICLFAGNMGKYQGLDFLFELIRINQDKKNVVFLIVGSGSESESLRSTYSYLENVVFKEFIDPEQYPDLVRQCDIGLINLNTNLTVQNIPGKLMGYWCSKLPVLAAINAGNDDLQKIFEDSQGGLWSITGDLNEYISNFDMLYEDKILRRKMGESGYAFVCEHFSVDYASNRILGHFI